MRPPRLLLAPPCLTAIARAEASFLGAARSEGRGGGGGVAAASPLPPQMGGGGEGAGKDSAAADAEVSTALVVCWVGRGVDLGKVSGGVGVVVCFR